MARGILIEQGLELRNAVLLDSAVFTAIERMSQILRERANLGVVVARVFLDETLAQQSPIDYALMKAADAV